MAHAWTGRVEARKAALGHDAGQIGLAHQMAANCSQLKCDPASTG
jgi:hypothetical protein